MQIVNYAKELHQYHTQTDDSNSLVQKLFSKATEKIQNNIDEATKAVNKQKANDAAERNSMEKNPYGPLGRYPF